jgi:serine/threonine protein kinase
VQGTPAFIAPEQALGRPHIDNRADIYGTGCLAYWLLTGQLVFTGNTPMQLLVQHAQTMPEPPSARTELPIPPELDAIVLTCLAKDPSGRPRTARELGYPPPRPHPNRSRGKNTIQTPEFFNSQPISNSYYVSVTENDSKFFVLIDRYAREPQLFLCRAISMKSGPSV